MPIKQARTQGCFDGSNPPISLVYLEELLSFSFPILILHAIYVE